MALYERLLGLQEPTISVHEWMAGLGELERGYANEQDIIDAFTLDAGEQAEADALIAKIILPLEAISIGGFSQITNVGVAYDTVVSSQGLGSVRIETAGMNALEFAVRVNKAGAGTQDWQLWNETDGSQVAVLSDSGAVGVKNLGPVQVDFDPPLSGGVKTLRIRARSSTAADDPAFMGATLLIRRTGRMTTNELHEVLLLARAGIEYETVVTLKARLGTT